MSYSAEVFLERIYAIQSFTPVGVHVSGLAISSAVDLTLTKPTGATKILIQALTQNIRFTLDGSTPTASKGFQLLAGGVPIVIMLNETTPIKVIQESATASLQYQWGR